jgi:hypothetical protein
MMARPTLPNEAVVAPAAVFTFFMLAFAWPWAFWLLASLMKTEAPVAATALAWRVRAELGGGGGSKTDQWNHRRPGSRPTFRDIQTTRARQFKGSSVP